MSLFMLMTFIGSLSFAIYLYFLMLYHLYIDITLAVNKKESTEPLLPRTRVINFFCIKRLLTNSQPNMSTY